MSQYWVYSSSGRSSCSPGWSCPCSFLGCRSHSLHLCTQLPWTPSAAAQIKDQIFIYSLMLRHLMLGTFKRAFLLQYIQGKSSWNLLPLPVAPRFLKHLYCKTVSKFSLLADSKPDSAFSLVPWVVSTSVLPDMLPQQRIKGVGVICSLPGSCCSRVRCCTWSLGSGCTCYSRPPPLWHTPKRQTNRNYS